MMLPNLRPVRLNMSIASRVDGVRLPARISLAYAIEMPAAAANSVGLFFVSMPPYSHKAKTGAIGLRKIIRMARKKVLTAPYCGGKHYLSKRGDAPQTGNDTMSKIAVLDMMPDAKAVRLENGLWYIVAANRYFVAAKTAKAAWASAHYKLSL